MARRTEIELGGWLSSQIVFPVISAAVGATGAVLVRHAWEKRLGPSHGVPHPLLADTLGARLVASSLAFLPTPRVVFGPRDLPLDAALGGYEGEGRWRYWTSSDGSPSGVVVSYLLGKSGWPKDMTNRSEDDTWAPGAGFDRGKDVEKVYEGAKKRGWLVTPVFERNGKKVPETAGSDVGACVADLLDRGVVVGEAFKLDTGDYFALRGGAEVGVVVEVGDGDGSRNVVTVEGCLRTTTVPGAPVEPCARWHTRVFHDDGRFTPYGAPAARDDRLLWVVRPT